MDFDEDLETIDLMDDFAVFSGWFSRVRMCVNLGGHAHWQPRKNTLSAATQKRIAQLNFQRDPRETPAFHRQQYKRRRRRQVQKILKLRGAA